MTGLACVVGAGISGLSAAQALRRRHGKVVVVDKSRGVGGRMATRRMAAAAAAGVADHGAQFFTARAAEFRAQVAEWQTAGVVEPWYSEEEIRYRGVGGMTAPAKALVQGLDLHLSSRVTAVQPLDRQWDILCEDGRSLRADALVLTAPVPQTLALLDAGGCVLEPRVRAGLEAVQYDPCLALLVALDGPSRIPPPGGLASASAGAGLDPRLLWIADNQGKGISPARVTLTLHATPECSRRLWEATDEAIADELLAAAGTWVGSAVVAAQVHRWRYARPTAVHQAPRIRHDRLPPLAFAGDAFAGARVEAAYLSGLRAAEAILAACES